MRVQTVLVGFVLSETESPSYRLPFPLALQNILCSSLFYIEKDRQICVLRTSLNDGSGYTGYQKKTVIKTRGDSRNWKKETQRSSDGVFKNFLEGILMGCFFCKKIAKR